MNIREKHILFAFTLKHKMVRNLQVIIEQVGELIVEGTGYCEPSAHSLDSSQRYSVSIIAIRWNGIDIKAVMEVSGLMEEIEQAAVRHAAQLFTPNKEEVTI